MQKRVWLAALLVLMLVFSSFAAYAEGHEDEQAVDAEADVEDTVEDMEDEEAMEDAEEALEEEMEEVELPSMIMILVINEDTAMVNGELVTLDVAPVIADGRTLVPFRFIGEALGATIDWNEEERAASYTKDGMEIVLHLDMAHAIINGEEVELDTAPVVMNGRIMVPVRFVSETLGYEVAWEAEASRVTITGELAVEEDVVEDDMEEELEEDEELEEENMVDEDEEADLEEEGTEE
jgi:hypothetical protein